MTDEAAGTGEDRPRPDRLRDGRTGRTAASVRMAHQHSWVDQQIRVAMAKGEFDDLPGAGKPIADLGESHDPDWWIKRLVEREQLSVLPESLQLRKDEAELDSALDRLGSEREVREQIEAFNQRVFRARYDPQPGPPLVTQPQDVEATLAAWRERRAARVTAAAAVDDASAVEPRRRRWPRRRRAD